MAAISESKDGCFTFEWETDDLSSLTDELDEEYLSPDFEFGGGTWHLQMYPNGRTPQHEGEVRLFLKRKSLQSATHIVTCKLTFKRKSGQILFDCPEDRAIAFTKKETVHELLPRIILSNLLGRLNQVSVEPLVISCNFRWEHFSVGDTPEGVPESVSSSAKLWIDFGRNLLGDKNCDVIVKVEDREFMFHMDVLEKYPVLYSMLKPEAEGEKMRVVVLPDCDPDIFQDIRHFLYFEAVNNMNAFSVINLYTAADKYGIDSLKTYCTEFMKKKLSVETFFNFVNIAVRYNDLVLLEAGTEFFMGNVKSITATVEWQSFMVENPAIANDMIEKAKKKSVSDKDAVGGVRDT